ncbi:MAG TPA: hypothetical protein VFM59_03035, partial [Salinimicrobium sp.]|nr:hypothetical protein [Salinimicrobium sp.]
MFGFIGCDEDSQESTHAYIGGEIVNPESEYVVISKNNQILDTVPLDESNRFSYKIEEVESNTYFLQHSSESQLIHMQAGDSLLLRVNTIEFDESLHFSGEGAGKNNFLINTFLLNEKNTGLILSHYKIEPEVFAAKTDSIRSARLEDLEELKDKHDFSEDFLDLANNIIKYEHYDLRERYTFLVNKYYEDFAGDFPEEFHDYRKDVDFNEEKLQTNPAFLRFMHNYLINISIAHCLKKEGATNKDCFNLNGIENIKTRIRVLDTLTDLPLVKKNFLGRLGAQGIIMGKNREDLISVLELLQEKGIDNEKLFELRQLGTLQMAFVPGTSLKNAPFIDSSEKDVVLGEISSKPTVIYFWSIYSPNHHKEEHKIINEMRKKYPEINFLGLNIDLGQTSQWINALRKYNYDMDQEYQLGLMELAGKPLDPALLKNYLNKLLFLDASGEVIIGDAYLYSPNF